MLGHCLAEHRRIFASTIARPSTVGKPFNLSRGGNRTARRIHHKAVRKAIVVQRIVPIGGTAGAPAASTNPSSAPSGSLGEKLIPRLAPVGEPYAAAAQNQLATTRTDRNRDILILLQQCQCETPNPATTAIRTTGGEYNEIIIFVKQKKARKPKMLTNQYTAALRWCRSPDVAPAPTGTDSLDFASWSIRLATSDESR